MVDGVSAEDRIKDLLEESRSCTYPEDPAGIRLRYKDTASSSVSQYGNTPIVVRKSRSSNGELSTVVEQVPSLRGRSSVSDYTLVDAKTRDSDEDSNDTADDLSSHKFRDIAEGNESTGEIESPGDLRDDKNKKPNENGKHKSPDDLIDDKSNKSNENGKHNHEREVTKNGESDVRSDSTPAGQNDASSIAIQTREHDNRKSFSHYDLPIQRLDQDPPEEEEEEEERTPEDSDQRTSEPGRSGHQRTPQELGGLGHHHRHNKEVRGKSVLSPKSEHNGENPTSCHDNNSSLITGGQHNAASGVNDDSQANESRLISQTPNSLGLDHEAVLRAYIEQSSSVNKPTSDGQIKSGRPHVDEERASDGFDLVELKIVEPIDDSRAVDAAGEGLNDSGARKTVTTDILNYDGEDVTFIDASSPTLVRTKIIYQPSLEWSQELPQVNHGGRTPTPSSPAVISTPTPPKRRGKSLGESSPPQLGRWSRTESLQHLRGESVEDLSKYLEIENHSVLLGLPIRSPTPPKRSPRRSPRVPRGGRDKNKLRQSSAALSTDEESRENDPDGTRSASPSSKSGETSRFFSFSLKKEKSKSASSLTPKRARGNRLSSVKIDDGGGDPGVVNPVVVGDKLLDGQFESAGKRVGVRSMVIDGTIKRNFIVIHPSDDSETIGLAPLSPTSNNNNNNTSSVMNTSTAFSSVKSHITGRRLNNNLESVKRRIISSKGDLREGLADAPGGSSNSGLKTSKSLRAKKTVNIVEHRPLGSSRSLSSDPTCSSVADSQVLFRSPLATSEIDCDSVNDRLQRLNDDDDAAASAPPSAPPSRTVSKLCVVM
ncbi:hypothetical protein Hamer_G001159 [Homarus americanus]|uniref:Uncharacterized protein n=1 Tax=Homarus americanus TaxID=6706 RepID=A0A8J5N2J6_HOMAM|nr:hypothetical protein Hamer_G001159 [Homarus americanus]